MQATQTGYPPCTGAGFIGFGAAQVWRRKWYGDTENASFTLNRVHGDRVVQHSADAIHNGQAKAQPLLVTAMLEAPELLENMGKLVFGHSWADIPDLNAQVAF